MTERDKTLTVCALRAIKEYADSPSTQPIAHTLRRISELATTALSTLSK